MSFALHHHDVLDSTSSEAARRVRAGAAAHGEVHVAREQTEGRGRLGRPWHGAAGAGLYLSVVWRCASRPDGAAATMAAGLAVLDAVRALGLEGARLDWPNDVEATGGKLAGVLIEALADPRGGTALVVGIGVNVAQRDFPEELTRERAVTSLALEGVAVTVDAVRERLLVAVATRLEQALDGNRHERLAHDFLVATELLGGTVLVRVAERDGETTHRGTLVSLALDGGIEVATDRGPRHVALEHVRALERG